MDKLLTLVILCASLWLQGCTSVNTFSAIARPGDTVSVMIGSSEKARKDNISATFTDAAGQAWNLKTLGLLRSVFNLRADGNAYGQHYSSALDSYISWAFGHEPLQTVLITDVPLGVAPGKGSLTIALAGSDDNSSGAGSAPFNVNLEIIPGTGKSEQFLHQVLGGSVSANFGMLEASPYAKVNFGTGVTMIGAVSMVVAFNETVVNPNDLNIYVPESAVRVSSGMPDAFGKTQRMIYWHKLGGKLYVDIVAPQGIDPRYLQFFVVHPRGLAGSPAFNILSAQVYGIDGGAIGVQPSLAYYP